MITCCDTQDFTPFGREYLRRHPGQFQVKTKCSSPVSEQGLPFIKSFKEISLAESAKKEDWVFRHQEDEEVFDEELYVRGATVVWSRGGQDGLRAVVKTFTMDGPVLQALWGSFVLSSDDGNMDARSTLGAVGKEQRGICVVESSTLSFFVEGGGDYITPLPFQVSRTWVINNGLLFCRSLTHAEMSSQKRNCPSQTVVFSMLHPLEDVTPVITRVPNGKGAPKVSYLTDSSMTLIFTCPEPSLAFSYDSTARLHSVWRVRSARTEEVNQLCNSADTSFLNTTPHCNLLGGSNLSPSLSRQYANLSTTTGPSNSSQSPIRSFNGKIMSPDGILRASPSLVNPLTAKMFFSPGLRRPFPSPSLTSAGPPSSMFRLGTPPPRSPSTSMLRGASPASPMNSSFGANDTFYADPSFAVQPSVCLDLIWTESTQQVKEGSLGKASKAFLTEDLCGQRFLCYLVPYKQQLRCLKFEESNDGSQWIFGSLTFLSAKDATPIESQSLLLVLETSGVLILYSGTTRVSQVHIPVLPLGSGSLSLLRPMTPMGSPSRGDVLTSSRPPSALDVRFGDEMTHISPVSAHLEDSTGMDMSLAGAPLGGSSFIQGLRDNRGGKFSVELLSGALCRTELPAMTDSPGVSLCLRALKHQLPSAVALQVLARWYTVRNAPGGVGNVPEWAMFTKCVLALMGYDTGKLGLTSKGSSDGSSSPVLKSKKARPSDQGDDQDWTSLLSSEHHTFSCPWHPCLGLPPLPSGEGAPNPSTPCAITTTALLYPFCPAVLIALHMVYEEMKLSVLMQEESCALAPLVHQVACDLQCWSYTDYYRRDFPSLFEHVDDISQISDADLQRMQYPNIYPKQVPSVIQWVSDALSQTSDNLGPMLYIPGVCESVFRVVSVYSVMVNPELPAEMCVDKCLKKIPPAGHRPPTTDSSLSASLSKSLRLTTGYSQAERLVLTLVELGVTHREMDCLPIGISMPLREACLQCRTKPPGDWPKSAYDLIGRQDLSELAALPFKEKSFRFPEPVVGEKEKGTEEEDDGMNCLDEKVLKLRFPKDLRLQEVRRLLQSARPVVIAIKQKPEVSDHDFIEEQEKALLSLCVRTMALGVGRGMFTLHTCQPMLTETLAIPDLCLKGRAPPRNTTVDLTRIDVPPNMAVWPQFHNGVAAGLRIADTTQVDSAWIIYNKPKELTNEFAGFLMALGLNGHLPNLNTFNMHEYISEGNELTAVAILLGMSAARRGTMDLTVTKVLSCHVSALLPPTSTELNIAHNVRVAAILGVGLLYQGTAHLPMAEMMLAEIGRPPGPEMDNCQDRDSYSLSAGLALGLIMFGRGNHKTGLSDLSLADILFHLMVGGHTRQMVVPQRERAPRAPSYLIKEGDSVNVDVTSPGATLALGMVFYDTENAAVSDWLKAPDTQFMLDQVRPDFLCLRTIAHGLVNWRSVLPTQAWVDSNIPDIVKKYAFFRPPPGTDWELEVDLQTMSQAQCSIQSGACLVMALKFAGSANRTAFKTLLESVRGSMRLLGDQGLLEQAGRSTVEACISVKLLALAVVMAGTGDLTTLRLCRAMRQRVGGQHHQLAYGNHMSHAMATGFLMLGGGKYSLKTTPDALGPLLCALYPHFPLSSTDNRYHLQAFRHLYVLACEPRLLIPRDVDTGQFCYVPLRLKFKGTAAYKSVSFDTGSPFIIPELSKLEEVQVTGGRYWPVTFKEDKNWASLRLLLQRGGVLAVKQRAGNLPYMQDPQGYRSLVAKSLMADHSSHLSCRPDLIKSFTSDAKVAALTDFFISPHSMDSVALQELCAAMYTCVTQEAAEAVCPHFLLRQLSMACDVGVRHTLGLAQLRLVMLYAASAHRLSASGQQGAVLNQEILLALRCRVETALDQWAAAQSDLLGTYLKAGAQTPIPEPGQLAHYLVWFCVPRGPELREVSASYLPPPMMAAMFPRLSVASVMRLHAVMTGR